MTEPRYFLVPGFSQAAGAWEGVLAALPEGGLAHALEIPAEEGFVQTAHALVNGRAGVWGGYSLGGRIALQLALDCPGRVDGLVLISTNPGIEDPNLRSVRRATDDELARWVESNGVEAFLDRWLAQPLFSHLEHARLNRLDSAEAIAHQLRTLGQGAHEPLWDRLHELAMPVAVVAGDHDEKYTAIARRAAATIGSNARLHIVPDAGHALLQEAPSAVADILQGI